MVEKILLKLERAKREADQKGKLKKKKRNKKKTLLIAAALKVIKEIKTWLNLLLISPVFPSSKESKLKALVPCTEISTLLLLFLTNLQFRIKLPLKLLFKIPLLRAALVLIFLMKP